MAKRIKDLIIESPVYNFLRFNILSESLMEAVQNNTKKNIGYYSSFLKPDQNKLIFDIGANKGNKIKAFLKMGYKVIAVEPEKSSLETLNFRYKNQKNVVIVPKGVSNSEGTETLHITNARSGLNTFSNTWVESLSDKEKHEGQSFEFKDHFEIPMTTVESLMQQYGVPYFIKIDVEGYELNVVKGMKRLPDYLSFEVNVPEFVNDANAIINYLSELNNNVKFQYAVSDHNLESKDWISKEEMLRIINKKEQRYFEIICAFPRR